MEITSVENVQKMRKILGKIYPVTETRARGETYQVRTGLELTGTVSEQGSDIRSTFCTKLRAIFSDKTDTVQRQKIHLIWISIKISVPESIPLQTHNQQPDKNHHIVHQLGL